MTNKKLDRVVAELRKHSAGWGFVINESIEMFEKQFVFPALVQAQETARQEERQKVYEELREAVAGHHLMRIIRATNVDGAYDQAIEDVLSLLPKQTDNTEK